jgi:phospholipase/carboxylesterase
MHHHDRGYDYLLDAGDAAAPALVLLHGTGDDAAAFLRLGRAVAAGATLVSVQGNVDENGMARFFRRKAMGVYDMADLDARTDTFAGFLDAILPAHGVDSARAVGVGYSNGANLLANLAFRHPRALRRLALLHPLIPFEPPAADLGGLEVLVTAGQRDPICPLPLTERLVAAMEARGADVRLVAHAGGHEIHPREIEEARAFVAG